MAVTSENQLLDRINRRLLDELQTDARVTMAELGRRINLSAPAVAERVQRLEQAGVITGYRSEGDRLPDRGGRTVTADDAPASEDSRACP